MTVSEAAFRDRSQAPVRRHRGGIALRRFAGGPLQGSHGVRWTACLRIVTVLVFQAPGEPVGQEQAEWQAEDQQRQGALPAPT